MLVKGGRSGCHWCCLPQAQLFANEFLAILFVIFYDIIFALTASRKYFCVYSMTRICICGSVINSLRHSEELSVTWFIIGSSNTKPLPGPLLTYGQFHVWSVINSLMQSEELSVTWFIIGSSNTKPLPGPLLTYGQFHVCKRYQWKYC